MLDPGISQLNELLAAAAVLSGFEINMFRDGEMAMQGGNGLTYMVIDYGQELAVLAKRFRAFRNTRGTISVYRAADHDAPRDRPGIASCEAAPDSFNRLFGENIVIRPEDSDYKQERLIRRALTGDLQRLTINPDIPPTTPPIRAIRSRTLVRFHCRPTRIRNPRLQFVNPTSLYQSQTLYA